jgi:hypothetical protein
MLTFGEEYIQTLLAQKKEEQLYLGILQKEEKKKTEQKVVLVTQHRIYFINAGQHKVTKSSYCKCKIDVHKEWIITFFL